LYLFISEFIFVFVSLICLCIFSPSEVPYLESINMDYY